MAREELADGGTGGPRGPDDRSGDRAISRSIREARRHARVACRILDTWGTRADDPLAALSRGWECLAAALGALDGTLAPERAAKLAALRASVAEGRAALTAPAGGAGCLPGPDERGRRRERRRSVRSLSLAADAAERLLHRSRGGTLRRAWCLLRRGGVLVLAAALALATVGGIAVALTIPDFDEGLTASYFSKPELRGSRFERMDHTIDFDWGDGSPMAGVPEDRFSVRWSGCIVVDEGTAPTLVAGADDGVKVWVDGDVVIDDWSKHPFRLEQAEEPLSPGVHPLRVEFFDHAGIARVFLGWELDGAEPVAVPAKNLVPDGGNRAHRCKAVPAKGRQ